MKPQVKLHVFRMTLLTERKFTEMHIVSDWASVCLSGCLHLLRLFDMWIYDDEVIFFFQMEEEQSNVQNLEMLPAFSTSFPFWWGTKVLSVQLVTGEPGLSLTGSQLRLPRLPLWVEPHGCVMSIMHGTSRGETLLTAGLGRDSPDVNCQHTQESALSSRGNRIAL